MADVYCWGVEWALGDNFSFVHLRVWMAMGGGITHVAQREETVGLCPLG